MHEPAKPTIHLEAQMPEENWGLGWVAAVAVVTNIKMCGWVRLTERVKERSF